MKKTSFAAKLFSNRYFALFLCIACMIFIFSRSMRSADASNLESDGIAEKIAAFLQSLFRFSVTDENAFVTVIRKLAHFSEFFLLGLLSYYTRAMFTRDILSGTGWSLFHGIFTALTDEALQYFFEGRSAEVKDVWIDFAGFMFAYAILCVIMSAITKKKKSRA